MAMLTEQTHFPILVDRDHGGAAGMVNDLQAGAMPVRERDIVDRDRDYPTAELN
jgi:hypothetical protein